MKKISDFKTPIKYSKHYLSTLEKINFEIQELRSKRNLNDSKSIKQSINTALQIRILEKRFLLKIRNKKELLKFKISILPI